MAHVVGWIIALLSESPLFVMYQVMLAEEIDPRMRHVLAKRVIDAADVGWRIISGLLQPWLCTIKMVRSLLLLTKHACV